MNDQTTMNKPESYEHVSMSWVGNWSGRRRQFSPRREALYDATDDRRYTYRDLDERARKVAVFLRDDLNVRKGEAVSCIARNRVELIDLYFACGKIGAVLAPISYRLAEDEIEDLLQRINPEALFYEEHFQDVLGTINSNAFPDHKIPLGNTASSYLDTVLTKDARKMNRTLKPLDDFLFVHTGGTTSTPKICRIPHRQMIWNSINMIASGTVRGGGNNVELLTFPLYHLGGWNTVTPVFHLGGRVVLTREFDPDRTLKLIQEENITHFGGVEAMLKSIANSDQFNSTSFESVEYINTAGGPCSKDVMDHFYEKDVPITQSYGLTEAGPSNCILPPDGFSDGKLREMSDQVGFPMFHCDARIVDPDTGEPVPEGETGELCFRNPHSFEGYLNQPERTEKRFDDEGWVQSGDLAIKTPEGTIKIVGRKGNMIISGGENIAPAEIEECLQEHPEISQAVVVGRPDEQWGERPVAAVIPVDSDRTPAGSQFRNHCKEHLAKFKVPDEIRIMESLPLTGAGKVDRSAVRDLFADQE